MVSGCPQAVCLREFSTREEKSSFPNIINIETFVTTGNIMLHPK